MKLSRHIGWSWLGLVLLSACSANHHSIFRATTLDQGATQILTLDAKQRSILTSLRLPTDGSPASAGVRRRFCAEPSPDVFSVVAQALSAGGTFGRGGDPVSIQAALNAAFSSAEQGSTIPRTQTINMLRELMYRTCERYLSGGYDDLELSVQAVRDQRLMVSILAIEQLTGAVTPRPVLIGASAAGTAGASGDAIVRLDDARRARERAEAAHVAAKTAYDQTDGEAKVCEAIRDKPDSELSDDQKAKIKPCTDARTALDEALSDLTTKTAAYDELSRLARSGGVAVSTSLSSDAEGGLDRVDPQAIATVSGTVQQIVASNFSDSSEIMLFCLRMLRNDAALDVTPPQASDLKSVCVSYLDRSVHAAEQRLALEISRSANMQDRAASVSFEQFWTRRQAEFAQADTRTALADEIRAKLAPSERALADCFAAATGRTDAEICFVALEPAVQRELADTQPAGR